MKNNKFNKPPYKCNKCKHDAPPSICGWCDQNSEFEPKEKNKILTLGTITIGSDVLYKYTINVSDLKNKKRKKNNKPKQ